MKQPWLKWYPSDWFGDKGLRLCSLAARGLWHELCLIAHACEPYGHVRPGGGIPTADEIAILVGVKPEVIPTLLAELEKRQVFSRTEDGAIFSRRMVRDGERSAKCAEWGAKGGNPNLGDKPRDNPRDKPSRAPVQKPEVRSQKKRERASPVRLSQEQVREAIALRPTLDTVDFRLAFTLWLEYRDEKRLQPYLPIGLQSCLTRLAKLGPVRAIAAMEYTRAQGWQGIREEERQRNGAAPAPAPQRRDDYHPDPAAVLERRRRVEAQLERQLDPGPRGPNPRPQAPVSRGA